MMQYDKRDQILFQEPYQEEKYSRSIRPFEGLKAQDCLALINLGFLDRNMSYNDAPFADEYLDFMKKFAKEPFRAHGYAKSATTGGIIVIEGLSLRGNYSKEALISFANKFHDADEFLIEPDSMWCWYD